jgi:hypothetical protein
MNIERLKNSGLWYGRPEGEPYELKPYLRRMIIEQIAELLTYDGHDHRDDIREASACYVDSHGWKETRDDWAGAGYPEPHHFDGWELEEIADKTIHDRQKLGTALALIEWTASLFDGCRDREEALWLATAYLNDTPQQTERCDECPTHCHA